MSQGSIRYESARRWPLVFPDVESLRTFWATLERFVVPTEAEAAAFREGTQTGSIQANVIAWVHGKMFTSVEDLLEYPQRNLHELRLEALGRPGHHVTIWMHLSKANTDLSLFRATGGYVFVSGTEVHNNSATMVFRDVVDTFLAMTRPATLWERLRRAPIVTKLSEAELYADSRAAKVRWQSWVGAAIISLLGGYAGAFFQQILK
ncbi:hypothetical protein [Arthrobacter sp. M4]|uniref:hypothetical protein n=1 Tax=Arthrobacter sp. M4 TaxID=218160 RepID=UPI001CDD3169|nr:hypothetical protein [Arthrobacter sp. M4]MCA4132937.1 hypothetical protein [Arthrobacter sp. M4]